MHYPKINTIWQRDEKKFNIIEGAYSCPEFEGIKKWDITEKVHGTNIRVNYEDDFVKFGGKSDEAQISAVLFEYLQKTFTVEKLKKIFPDVVDKVILFGEEYGHNIETAGKEYSKDIGFILFDAYVDGWWLERKNVIDIAIKAGIKFVPSQYQTDVVDQQGYYVYERFVTIFRAEELPTSTPTPISTLTPIVILTSTFTPDPTVILTSTPIPIPTPVPTSISTPDRSSEPNSADGISWTPIVVAIITSVCGIIAAYIQRGKRDSK